MTLFTDNYGNDESKEWTIVAPNGHVLRLVFDTFNTEVGYDEVRVYDGCTDNDHLLYELSGEFNGDELTDSILSTVNVLHITFTSDRNVTKRGFSATASDINDENVENGKDQNDNVENMEYGNGVSTLFQHYSLTTYS